MDQVREWVHPNAPLEEGYWEALLRDGENGRATPAAEQRGAWGDTPGEPSGVSPEPEAGEDQWGKAQRTMEQGRVLDLPVVGCNRGGLLVEWDGLRGFVPASHLVDLALPDDESGDRQVELRRFVGSRLDLKIIELDREQEQFILSERAVHLDEEEKVNLLDELRPGDTCEGRVSNICSFGAFVDLGGFEGLIHISELSWARIDHPSEILEPGQPVEVYVLDVDRDRERVGLSLKRLQPDPWQCVEEEYHVGQIVEGVVTDVVNFGAFVEVEEGLEGLIHVSELSGAGQQRDAVQEGDVVAAQVLNVDGEQRRMGLRLQQIQRSGSVS